MFRVQEMQATNINNSSTIYQITTAYSKYIYQDLLCYVRVRLASILTVSE